MDYFAIFGSPISHSLSPQIHHAFAKQFDIEMQYKKIETVAGQLNNSLQVFRQSGGKGANITLPLKKEAFTLCKTHFDHAREAHVVNTIGWDNAGLLWGDNTDGEGLIRDLINKGISLQGKTVLLLGAGGAAQGILPSLASLCTNITIVNRDLGKAHALSHGFTHVSPVTYESLNDIKLPFDVVINATSASLHQKLPPLSKHWIKSTLAIDLVYDLQQDTPFMQWANANGAKKSYDGLGMLIEQAALAFERWYRVKPDTAPMPQILKMNS